MMSGVITASRLHCLNDKDVNSITEQLSIWLLCSVPLARLAWS